MDKSIKTTFFYKTVSLFLLIFYAAHLMSFEAVMFLPLPSTPNEHPIKDFLKTKSGTNAGDTWTDCWLLFFKHGNGKEDVTKCDILPAIEAESLPSLFESLKP